MKEENTQTSPKKSKTPDQEIDEEFNEDTDLAEEDEDLEEEKPKPKVTKTVKAPEKVEKVENEDLDLAERIRSLHDTGIYRFEKLRYLHEINTNLSIIAKVLVDKFA